MTLLTGRTPSKFIRFILEDSGGILRELPITKINGIGLTHPEVSLVAIQDALAGFLSGIPGVSITINGPMDDSSAVGISSSGVKPALSGSHNVLQRLNGLLVPRSFAIAIGLRGYWQTGDPVFNLSSTDIDGVLVSDYTVVQNNDAIEYTAKIAIANGSAAPTLGTTLPATLQSLYMFAETGVYYTNNALGGNPVWSKVAGAMPDVATLSRANVALDGSAIYLTYPQDDNKGLYRCANPQAISPAWSDILASQASGIYPYKLVGGNWEVDVWRSTLWCSARADGESIFYGYHWGAYDGLAWNWSGANWEDFDWRWAYSWVNCKNYGISNGNGGDIYYTLPDVTAINVSRPGTPGRSHWAYSINNHVTLHNTGAATYLYLPESDTLVTALTDINSINLSGRTVMNARVDGSILGNRVFVINDGGSLGHRGEIWIGDIANVVLTETWDTAQRVHDCRLAGGGPLIVTANAANVGEDVARVSYDNGSTWGSLNGNFWSVALTNQTFINSGVVIA